jgi:hypothetical protein
MIQSSLTFQGEHEAWRQRVNKEAGAKGKFFKTVEMSPGNFTNTGFTNSSIAATTLKPYHRSNIDRKLIKKGNYYMIDSTYMVASNPNTMRDLGPCRNAEYYYTVDGDDDLSGYQNTMQSFGSNQTPQQLRQQYIKSKGNKSIQNIIDYKNKDVYRFGGHTQMGDISHNSDAQRKMSEYERDYYKTTNNWAQSQDGGKQTITRDPHVKVNDYSKNFSQAIFNPGMVHSSSRRSYVSKTPAQNKRKKLGISRRRSIGVTPSQIPPQNMKTYNPQRTNAVVRKPDNYKRHTKPQSASRSFRSARTLSKMLTREKRQRQKLEKEAQDVKETLSNFYKS